MATTGKIYIGTSGFSYDHWTEGVFYPKNLSRKEWLPYYASQFNSVELNMTFFKVPEKESFVEWQGQVPPEFRFSVKGYNYITHLKKLTGISEPLRFLMDRVMKLKNNLAVILWEIPVLGNSRVKLLEGFLGHLKKYPKILYAFDLKDPLLQVPEVYALLRNHQVTIVENDENEGWIKEAFPLPFRYIRLRGQGIKDWEKKIKKAKESGETCFAYFTDEHQGKAIQDAQHFAQALL